MEKNNEKAAKWYRKAAEQGHTIAQYFLGEMYYYGVGVLQDKVEAVKWWRKAAEQGTLPVGDSLFASLAQRALGQMYYEGEGVPKNFIEAYAWFLLLKADGEEVSEMISTLEKRLTAEQIEKGQARAAELRRLIEQKEQKSAE